MEQRKHGDQPQETLFTTLADLLIPASTMPLLDSADDALVERLFEYLPEHLVHLVREEVDTSALEDPNSTAEQKQALLKEVTTARKNMLRKVLRSPQFSQSLASLTIALREGGLPIISESVRIPVRNGGYLRHGGVPMGGGEAVEAFIDGVKTNVEEELAKESRRAEDDGMDQD